MKIQNILLCRIVPWFGIKNHHPREIIIPFPFAYTANILSRQGFNVKVFDTAVEKINFKNILEVIDKERPDLLVLETSSSTLHIAEDIIKEKAGILKNNIVIVVREVGIRVGKEYFRGELEYFLPYFLKKFPEGQSSENLSNFIKDYNQDYNQGLIEDLDSLGHIDYRFFKMDRYFKISVCPPFVGKKRWGFILSSRGCPYGCIFCSPILRNSIGTIYRRHSPSWVVDEIEYLIRNCKVNAISFEDDIFTFDKEYVEQICDKLMERRINIYWTARSRADLLNENILKKMKKAGCFALGIGVESGSDRILKHLNKGENTKDMAETIRTMRKIGIMPLLYFIIGNPTETYEEMEETFRFAKRLKAYMVQFHYFTPYPGSKIFESIRKKNLILQNLSHYDGSIFNLSAIPTKILERSLKRFYLRYYLSLDYLWRYIRFRFPYVIFDSNEIRMILQTLKFLFLPSRHQKLRNVK